jgi:NitT/TauT family transport system ATP-binding protein
VAEVRAPSEPLAVAARNVSMVYQLKGKGEGVLALDDFSLDMRPGELVSIIGPSGCGKSTFMRLVADLIRPTAGEIQVCGMSPPEARRTRAYSFVFQNPVLFPWLTLEQNVGFALKIIGTPARERRTIVRERIELVGLAGFENALPRQLSGGMRQRAAIARALTLNPSLLLMDEPFGALDEITRDRMNLELLRVLSETGAAVLFVTHSIDEAVILSDRIVVMTPRPGRILKVIPIDLPKPRNRATRYLPAFVQATIQAREALHEGEEG